MEHISMSYLVNSIYNKKLVEYIPKLDEDGYMKIGKAIESSSEILPNMMFYELNETDVIYIVTDMTGTPFKYKVDLSEQFSYKNYEQTVVQLYEEGMPLVDALVDSLTLIQLNCS